MKSAVFGLKKEYDLKKMKKRPGKVKVDPNASKVPVSMRFDGVLLANIRTAAHKKGLPYQTYISSILHQYINGELVDVKTVELLKKLV